MHKNFVRQKKLQDEPLELSGYQWYPLMQQNLMTWYFFHLTEVNLKLYNDVWALW